MTGVVRLEEFLREKWLRLLGHLERMDGERGPVKYYSKKLMGQIRKTEKRWKEVLECDMTARGLQRLDAHCTKSWKMAITLQKPADLCWAPEIEESTFLEQNDDDVEISVTVSKSCFSQNLILK